MTEKQENILKAALQLFAKDGYNAVSTSKVALSAGVSEGLVFRHFKSKEGLLIAVMEYGKKGIINLFIHISKKTEPKSILRGIIQIPFGIGQEEYHFWRLFYMVKWQNEKFKDNLFDAIYKLLVKAFKDLKYSNPEIEAEIVMYLIDGVATNLLLRIPDNTREILNSIYAKYEL
jgi:AcrR family transcriptional regulator